MDDLEIRLAKLKEHTTVTDEELERRYKDLHDGKPPSHYAQCNYLSKIEEENDDEKVENLIRQVRDQVQIEEKYGIKTKAVDDSSNSAVDDSSSSFSSEDDDVSSISSSSDD